MTLKGGYHSLTVQLPTHKQTLYIKQHRSKDSDLEDDEMTLFVANVPNSTKILSKILSKVIPSGTEIVQIVTSASKNCEFTEDNNNPFHNPNEKFAHVRLALKDEDTKKFWKYFTKHSTEVVELNDHIVNNNSPKNVLQLYRSKIKSLEEHEAECTEIVEEFEGEEEAMRQKRLKMASEPDEDGFIMVSDTTNRGLKRSLNDVEGQSNTGHQRKNKRNRQSKKKSIGAEPRADFYRFQMKESKKKEVLELRKKFEQDLKSLQRMKEQKVFKPF